MFVIVSQSFATLKDTRENRTMFMIVMEHGEGGVAKRLRMVMSWSRFESPL